MSIRNVNVLNQVFASALHKGFEQLLDGPVLVQGLEAAGVELVGELLLGDRAAKIQTAAKRVLAKLLVRPTPNNRRGIFEVGRNSEETALELDIEKHEDLSDKVGVHAHLDALGLLKREWEVEFWLSCLKMHLRFNSL